MKWKDIEKELNNKGSIAELLLNDYFHNSYEDTTCCKACTVSICKGELYSFFKSKLREAMESVVTDANYHYWRECHKCGHAGGGYLHCVHDHYQSRCHKCGELLSILNGECDCEFVLTESDIKQNIEEFFKEE